MAKKRYILKRKTKPGFRIYFSDIRNHIDNTAYTYYFTVEEMRSAHKISVETLQGEEDNIKIYFKAVYMEMCNESDLNRLRCGGGFLQNKNKILGLQKQGNSKSVANIFPNTDYVLPK